VLAQSTMRGRPYGWRESNICSAAGRTMNPPVPSSIAERVNSRPSMKACANQRPPCSVLRAYISARDIGVRYDAVRTDREGRMFGRVLDDQRVGDRAATRLDPWRRQDICCAQHPLGRELASGQGERLRRIAGEGHAETLEQRCHGRRHHPGCPPDR
jgi:hypothetical protein